MSVLRLTLLVFSAFFALLGTLPCDAQKNRIQEEKKPWWDSPQPRFSHSELGRVFTGTIDLRGDAPVKHRTIYKAIAVRLGKEGKDATVIFDTEMVRMVCAVPEKPVMFNTYRDGLGGAGHWVGDPYLFTAQNGPGWASKEGSFEDPRAKDTRPNDASSPTGQASGPLPREWAQYLGHHRYRDRVIFSYRVGGVQIHDMPWAVDLNGSKVITRNLRIDRSKHDLVLRVSQAIENDGQATMVALSPNSPGELLKKDGEWFLKIPPQQRAVKISLFVSSLPADQADAFQKLAATTKSEIDLVSATEGGPAQLQTFETVGELSKEKGPYVVDTITPPFQNADKILFRFAGHDFFSNGDIAVCTIDGDVWRVSGVDDKLQKLTWKRYATGLFQPLGLRIVKDQVYVLGRDQITRLYDINGNQEADFYQCFNNQCKIGKHVHEFATGLETDPQGNFYFVKGHGANNEHAGTLLKVSADGSDLEVVATGFRWPNGSGAGPNGELTVADQQGTWVPSSRIDLIKKGGFYGFMNAHQRPKDQAPKGYDGPLCWIPHKVDNSCGGQTWNTSDKWGPFKGHMVHCSYGKCHLFMVLQENIDGVDQAGVFRFPFKFQSGGMRARFSPHDGQLYVSGLKGWQTSGAKDGCLQRVRYTGAKVALPKSLHVHKNGIRVGFTQELDKELAEDLDSWQLEQWNYRWTKAYGSKEFKLSDPSKTGHDPVEVTAARLLPNKREVFLTIPNLGPVMQMKIHYDLETTDGDEMIGDLHNTIHALAAPFK